MEGVEGVEWASEWASEFRRTVGADEWDDIFMHFIRV